MPGPFPGMDPYIESNRFWRGAHTRIISRLAFFLNAQLPADYIAEIDERVYVVQDERGVYPDVSVLRRYETPDGAGASTGGTAVADPPSVVELYAYEVREPFIEILRLPDGEQVVTMIELLSPSNKARGSSGRDLYLEKQTALLDSGQNLIEIDLHRSGAHTVATPRELIKTDQPWDYIVSLHRGSHRLRYEFWPVSVRSRLPKILIPLSDGVPDEVFDLQTAFDAAYDELPYDRRIDYRRDPEPPLTPDDGAWADTLLRERGLRP